MSGIEKLKHLLQQICQTNPFDIDDDEINPEFERLWLKLDDHLKATIPADVYQHSDPAQSFEELVDLYTKHYNET